MKFRNRILLILLVILVSSQPILIAASSINSLTNESEEKDFQLFMVTEAINIDNEINILEGTILYGLIEDEFVHIQYKDRYVEVSGNQLENITNWNSSEVPNFINHNALDKGDESIGEEINQDALYGYSMDSDQTLQLHGEIEVTQLYNEEYEYILLGNVPHFLNAEDFEKAIAESNVKEDLTETEVEEEVEPESDEVEEKVEPESDEVEEKVEPESDEAEEKVEPESDEVEEKEQEAVESQDDIEILPNDKEIKAKNESIDPTETNVAEEEEQNISDAIGTFSIFQVQEIAFSDSDKYFLAKENLPVYDNRRGKLVQVGELKKGQIYPRYESSPSWHRLQFGDYKAFVKKEGTEPASGSSLKNLNDSYSNQDNYVTAKKDITVYDNSSGNLIPFGTIKSGQKISIAYDYGGAWIYIIFADRVGFIKSDNVQKEYFLESDKYFRVTDESLPIYDNRNGNLVKVGELIKGEVYPRGIGSPNWHAIDFNGFTAYVKSEKTEPASGKNIKNKNNGKYKNQLRNVISNQDITVYDNTSGTLKPFAKIAKGLEYSIARDYNGDWIYIILADRIGYIRNSEVKRTFIPSDKYFKVTDENTPVYDNRSGKLVKVGELVEGQVYKRGIGSPAWQAIDFGDFQGYIRTSQTEPSNGNSITNLAKTTNSIGYLTPKIKVPVYDNSGKGNMVTFAYLEKGKKYPVVKEYNSWYQINLGGRYGFIKRTDVTAKVGVRIFLDPGHGEHDPGGTGFGLNEKDVVLDIAMMTANFLRSNYLDVVVQLSRTSDVFIELTDRAEMANNWGADYFVSLHNNAFNGSTNGFETFIYNGSVSQETKDRQEDVHNYIINRMNASDRGMKTANFSVLRNTEMPSILIEYLFIDNRADNQLLKSASYRTTLARITAEAIAYSYGLTAR
ncbi:N-acetylmuramoyl-L-alanine amidase family protein [Oceanobacillus rekensis]|uniref:N-acetylmuramoyl-L-alanine amidase family protein n=1 Tax=Oceanobacillus rekensis TaxID=937927 RepID=UPI000B452971|nr:N-acetylmuramoyl-L-alanine amidase [Oceanobacillus rekensis]